MGLRTLRTRFLKGGAEGPPPFRVIPVVPEPGADRVKENEGVHCVLLD